MKEAGIFYGSSTGKTESVAHRIFEKMGEEKARVADIAEIAPKDLLKHKILFLGISTWGIGRLQDDWEELLPQLAKLDLSGRRVALFGLGDQESYPGTFADALGTVYKALIPTGCVFVGEWSTQGYDFQGSTAVQKDVFPGLVLDEDNQAELTDGRIDKWLRDVKKS